MTLDFRLKLEDVLEKIDSFLVKEFVIYEDETKRDYQTSDAWLERYHDAKGKIIALINTQYNTSYDLEEEDEVALFLREAGSNALSNSQFKCVYKFELYLGKKGFIIGVLQKGLGFNALKVNESKQKDNLGKGFDFYRTSQGVVFFDDAASARAVYLYKFL